MEDVWKPIPGYEGFYEASSFGNIKSLSRLVKVKNHLQNVREVILRQCSGKGGYLVVNLCLNGGQRSFQVHQLIAMAFHGHIPCKHDLVVNHIDRNKTNNSADNLNIITQRENSFDIKGVVSSKYNGVYFSAADKKWKSKIHFNKKSHHLGFFKDELSAYSAYLKFAKDNGIVLSSAYDVLIEERQLSLF